MDLPQKDRAAIDHLITPKELFRPLYRWQGEEACCYSSFGTIDSDNCLNVEETHRFFDFFEQAWEENEPVPYISKYAGRWLSAEDNVAGKYAPAKFGDFDLMTQIHHVLPRAKGFKRPSLIRDTT